MVNLPNVTLCAVSTANIALTQRAIDLSREQCVFGDVVFVTNADVSADYRVEKIKPFTSSQEGSNFSFWNLVEYIHTPFALFIQWDGYVLSGQAWTDEFLQYDYIGAKWTWHKDGYTVGNSGFCLRSRKLMETLASADIELPGEIPEDEYVCRILRPRLESEYGIQFAPESIADLFSYENSLPRQPTFGFHGVFNLWRHIDDERIVQLVHELSDYVLLAPDYLKMTVQYYLMRKFVPLRALYARLRQKLSRDGVLQNLVRIYNEPFAHECVEICENLIKESAPPAIPRIVLTHDGDAKQALHTLDPRGRLFPWER
jgi:hypothetical protein